MLGVILAGYTLLDILIFIIVLAACLGVLFVALRQFGVEIPPFLVTIFWIVVCAVAAVLAIRFLAGF